MLQQNSGHAQDRRELGAGSVISFGGAAFSAAAGFVLVIVLGRALGDSGAGVVFQVIAVFNIALAFGRVSMDSAAVWLLPRLKLERSTALPSTAWGMVAVSGLAGLIAAIAVIGWNLSTRGADSTELFAVIVTLPLAAMLMTGLAATRALGGVIPFSTIGNVLLPGLRPLLILGAVMAGWGVLGASIAWAVPVIPALLLAFLVMTRQLGKYRSTLADSSAAGPIVDATPTTSTFASGSIPRRIAGYAAPRVVSAIFEQVLVWGGVLMVGALASSADAGVYAAAARYVGAGMIIDTALRVVIAPMFSRLHHAGDFERLGSVFRTATIWLVLFSCPIFLLLAVFAPVMLGITGPEFVRGGEVLAIMSLGMLVVLLAGNIQSMLLMGGRSGLAAVNKGIAVAVNLALIPLLMPVMGIAGAAWAWVIATILDATLATVQVRFVQGIRLPHAAGLRPLLIGVLTVGLPALLVRIWLGPSWLGLVVAIAVCGSIFLAWCILNRSKLELTTLLPTGSARGRAGADRELRGINV